MTRHQFVDNTPTKWTPCIAPHQRDPERKRTATHGQLCEGHYIDLEQHIAEMPAQADEVERALVRYGNGLAPKVSGSKEQPLPYATDGQGNSRPSDALRDARTIYVGWCRNVLADHPSRLHHPADTLPAMSAFLLTHLPWCAQQPWADDLVREAREVSSTLRRSLTLARVRIVPLGGCDVSWCELDSHVEKCCEGTLRAFVPVVDIGADPRPIVCSECGTELPPETWRALAKRLRKDAKPMLTYAQLSQLLRVPVGTLRRWAHEDGWRGLSTKPAKWHMDDAQQSYETRRLEVSA